jgi:hypothetical protein
MSRGSVTPYTRQFDQSKIDFSSLVYGSKMLALKLAELGANPKRHMRMERTSDGYIVKSFVEYERSIQVDRYEIFEKKTRVQFPPYPHGYVAQW